MRNLVIAVVVLLLLGYGGYRLYHHQAMQQQYQNQAAQQTAAKPSPTHAMMMNSVYMSKSNSKLGTIMTDEKGMTLYTYAKDTSGVSTCTGPCSVAWPAYIAPAGKTELPANLSVIKRSDGMTQYAYKGMPLYYFAKDKNSGDTNGNGVGGVWSVVKL